MFSIPACLDQQAFPFGQHTTLWAGTLPHDRDFGILFCHVLNRCDACYMRCLMVMDGDDSCHHGPGSAPGG